MPTASRSAGSVPVLSAVGRPGRPRRPRLAPLLPAPVTTLDAPAGGAGTVSQLIDTGVPSYMSIDALLELACRSQRDVDWRQMYSLVRSQLVTMKLLPAHSPQLDPLRHMYQKVFAEILLAAHRVSVSSPLVDQPLLRPTPAGALHASRYRSEFEELAVLGRGGFAVVCRCRSLVDGQEYAVKRIPFACRSPAVAERTVREVAVFASLHHPNIVQYNTAWLEVDHWAAADAGSGSCGSGDGGAEATGFPSHSETVAHCDDSASWVQFEPCSLTPLTAASSSAGGHAALVTATAVSPSPLGGNASADWTGGGAASAVPPAGAFGLATTRRFWPVVGSSSTSSASSGRSGSVQSWSRSVSRWQRPPAAFDRLRAGGRLTLHIQMQLCDHTLKDWLAERNHAPADAAAGPLAGVDAERCRHLLRDVLLGVHFIHQRGIIHRDLKPANIFLASGRAMIGDFGLARPRAAAGASAEPLTPLADQTSGVGTATYASPEQAAGGDYGQPTDIYSLGVVSYELFVPFDTAMERGRALQRLRHQRHCCAELVGKWPDVAAAVVAMTELSPLLRPCAAHLLASPLFTAPADRLLQMEAAAAHQNRLLEARAARVRQLTEQLGVCRREAAVTERLLRNNCRQLHGQLADRDRELERLRALLKKAGIQS